jgi:hypothetical protein
MVAVPKIPPDKGLEQFPTTIGFFMRECFGQPLTDQDPFALKEKALLKQENMILNKVF